MKKETVNLILGGIGVVVALIALSPKGEGKDGSESGGFQIPTIFPAGSGAGDAAPTGGNNVYNISFPEFSGFPTGETKKESTTISGIGSLGVPYSSFGYDPTTKVYTSGIGSGVPGYEPLKSVSHAPTTKKTGYEPVKQTTHAPSGGGKSTGGMGRTYTKKTYVAGKTSHAYR